VAIKFPGHQLRAVAGFVFLRFFCPALIDPIAANLYSGSLSPDQRRALINITKVLQLMANQTTAFGEPWMIDNNVSHFVEGSKELINSLLADYTVLDGPYCTPLNASGVAPSAKQGRELIFKIHRIIAGNLKLCLQALVDTNAPVRCDGLWQSLSLSYSP
jgi:hypothetical protein